MPAGNALTLRQLRALLALEEAGTITGAAGSVHLTPPAVHTQLKSLAANLGAEIVMRTRSGKLELTPAGRLMAATARRIEIELAKAAEDLAALQKGYSGRVRLGVVSTGKYFAPALVAKLKRQLPDIEVVLVVGNRDQIISALEHRRVDLAIMGRPPREPAVEAETIGPHPHVLIAAPDHRLADKAHVSADDLMAETFIAREEGSGTRILMTRYLDRLGDGRVYDVMVMGSNETIKQAVIAGLGIAIISQHTVVEELKSGRLVRLAADGLPLLRHWFLIFRADTPLGPAAERLRGAISALGGDFLPSLDEDAPLAEPTPSGA